MTSSEKKPKKTHRTSPFFVAIWVGAVAAIVILIISIAILACDHRPRETTQHGMLFALIGAYLYLSITVGLWIWTRLPRYSVPVLLAATPLLAGFAYDRVGSPWNSPNAQVFCLAAAGIIATTMLTVEIRVRGKLSKNQILLYAGLRAAIAVSLCTALLGGAVRDPLLHGASAFSVCVGLFLILLGYLVAPFTNSTE